MNISKENLDAGLGWATLPISWPVSLFNFSSKYSWKFTSKLKLLRHMTKYLFNLRSWVFFNSGFVQWIEQVYRTCSVYNSIRWSCKNSVQQYSRVQLIALFLWLTGTKMLQFTTFRIIFFAVAFAIPSKEGVMGTKTTPNAAASSLKCLKSRCLVRKNLFQIPVWVFCSLI